jgi:hypothetical protein
MARRRDILTSLSGAVALAGCGSLGRRETTPTDTERSLSYIARVVSQASDSQPLTIEVGVQNDSERVVSIAATGRGKPFEELNQFTGDGGELVAVPPDNNRVSVDGLTQSPVDECWRLVGEDGERATIAAISTASAVSVAVDGRYAVRHHVYERTVDGPCFPPGEYESSLTVIAGGQQGEPAADLTYTLTVDESKQVGLTVDAAEPASLSSDR